mmetsp:Transcript_10901/g.21392  ORF Transcript_10901/g.21392 Transcript_10901/m.21392 type:complete len:224 (+) Transcript_10901:1554-2225(+)
MELYRGHIEPMSPIIQFLFCQILIADYGLTQMLEDNKEYYRRKGSKFAWQWTAPEALETSRFTMSSDIWALGVTFWEMATRGNTPYYTHRVDFAIDRIMERALKVELPPDVEQESPLLKTLFEGCMKFDAKQRMDARQLLKIVTNEIGPFSPERKDTKRSMFSSFCAWPWTSAGKRSASGSQAVPVDSGPGGVELFECKTPLIDTKHNERTFDHDPGPYPDRR